MQDPDPAKPGERLELPWLNVILRSERPDDLGFLAALFRSNAAPLFGVEPALAESLLATQFRSQGQTYHANYPAAWFAVMELEGQPFGRLIVDRGPVSHIVDYALMPAVQGRGLGTAILTALLNHIAGPVRNTVLCSNMASLAMCRRVGFAVVAQNDPFIEMEWRPGSVR